ncbi:hypothetical protein B0H10DRAFT_978380 [Mycena sp. CBHHK59/15]|nr:hypothetical protein B0H10DRAFT_978380 [Mycena sp. CBHHK59/15]
MQSSSVRFCTHAMKYIILLFAIGASLVTGAPILQQARNPGSGSFDLAVEKRNKTSVEPAVHPVQDLEPVNIDWTVDGNNSGKNRNVHLVMLSSYLIQPSIRMDRGRK